MSAQNGEKVKVREYKVVNLAFNNVRFAHDDVFKDQKQSKN